MQRKRYYMSLIRGEWASRGVHQRHRIQFAAGFWVENVQRLRGGGEGVRDGNGQCLSAGAGWGGHHRGACRSPLPASSPPQAKTSPWQPPSTARHRDFSAPHSTLTGVRTNETRQQDATKYSHSQKNKHINHLNLLAIYSRLIWQSLTSDFFFFQCGSVGILPQIALHARLKRT